jgi:plastocyanin
VRAPFSLPRLAATSSAGLLALALALTGCGSDATTDAGSAADHAGGASHSSSAADGTGSAPATGGSSDTPADTPAGTLTATESEFAIELSSRELTAGTYTVTVDHVGQGTHSLTIRGPGGVDVTSDTLQGGQSTTMTVTLQPGEYEVFCPIGNHRGMGMDTTLTVT